MARRARSRSRRNRCDRKDAERRLNVPLIVGVALFGIFFGLVGWAWLFFDQQAYETARKPPVVVVDISPALKIPEAEEDFEDRDFFDEEKEIAQPEERTAEVSRTTERVPDGSESAEASEEPAEPVSPLLPLPEAREVTLAPTSQPDPVSNEPEGPLPVIVPGGHVAWQVHARPFEITDPGIPRVALVIAGLGLSQAATEAAIQQLPGAVTLAFVPYAHNLEDWIAQARAAGHEVLLELPMEPFDYPDRDPGPHTLLTTLDSEENLARLGWLLDRFTGYVGVTSFMGAKFTTSAEAMEPILTELNDRGLLYLDSKASRNGVASDLANELELPSVTSDRFIDLQASRMAIDARLFELERIAKSAGKAVGVGFPYPVTIERVSRWARALGKKRYALAPLSAVVKEVSQE